jgi:hypothetical protein
MKLRSFWKIYNANKIFLEKLPFNARIFPWKTILTEFSHAYMDMPTATGNGQSGKSCPYLQQSRRSIG